MHSHQHSRDRVVWLLQWGMEGRGEMKRQGDITRERMRSYVRDWLRRWRISSKFGRQFSSLVTQGSRWARARLVLSGLMVETGWKSPIQKLSPPGQEVNGHLTPSPRMGDTVSAPTLHDRTWKRNRDGNASWCRVDPWRLFIKDAFGNQQHTRNEDNVSGNMVSGCEPINWTAIEKNWNI